MKIKVQSKAVRSGAINHDRLRAKDQHRSKWKSADWKRTRRTERDKGFSWKKTPPQGVVRSGHKAVMTTAATARTGPRLQWVYKEREKIGH